MALFDNGFRVGTGAAIGIGALILAPVLLPVVASAARPLIKAGMKGGIMLYEKGKEMIAETQELLEDLVAEVKAELSQEAGVSEILQEVSPTETAAQ
jgi:hypothetical protein